MSAKLGIFVARLVGGLAKPFQLLRSEARASERANILERPASVQPKAAAATLKMEQLKAEREALEKQVVELVAELEAFKKPDDTKVRPEHVVRTAEEREALEKMAKLELAEQNKAKEAAKAAATQKAAASKASGKKANPEGADKQQKKGGAEQQAALPIDISRLDLRIGKIIDVQKHPESDKLYIEKIDLGEESPRTILSGLAQHVPLEDMRDRIVLVLCNLKPAKLAGIFSEGMVMCASNEDRVEVVQPPKDAKPGSRVFVAEFAGEADAQLNPKKKIWEQVAVDIKTNDEGVATYKGIPLKIENLDGAITSSLKGVHIR